MKSVLIAEAHNVFRQGLAVVLEEQTSLEAVVQAASLAEARNVLQSVDGKVALAIVGLDLPDGDAAPLIEDLRAAGTPVLALAFEPDAERCTRALRAGADEVLRIASSCEKLVETASRFVES
jgi:DNA-binding NarL/FixJ family response regulator